MDLVILVGASLEEVRAIASEREYKILYERRFDSLDTDCREVYGRIQSGAPGAVAIAQPR